MAFFRLSSITAAKTAAAMTAAEYESLVEEENCLKITSYVFVVVVVGDYLRVFFFLPLRQVTDSLQKRGKKEMFSGKIAGSCT